VSREVVTSGRQIGEDQVGLGVLAAIAGLSFAALLARKQKRRPLAQLPSTVAAARRLNRAAGTLAFSVLFDSGIEHYRGSFHNNAMYTPLVISSLALAVSAHGLNDERSEMHRVRDTIYVAAALTGAIGTGFHVFNVSKGPGGINWQNMFYGAPLGAPAAIALSGLLGAAAERIRDTDPHRPRVFGLPAGRLAAAIASLGLLGTTGEASLLHFRGAFHNPFMFLPVTLPPVSGALLAEMALGKKHRSPWFTRWWLRLTAAMGFIGVCFHGYGIHRNMGGWRNWRQNILNGPPLPAPPSFAGLALAVLAALTLFEERPDA
jgi:hypothetical protein